MRIGRLNVEPFFKLYDFWVGLYVDTEAGVVYICLLPTCGIRLSLIMPEAL